MSKVNIRIEFDSGFTWWPVTETELNASKWYSQKPTLVVDENLIARYDAIAHEYNELQQIFEDLWRVQEGRMVDTSLLPDYEVIKT